MSRADDLALLDRARRELVILTCSVHNVTVTGWDAAEAHDAEFHS